jgi:hypothetical protein
VASAGKSIFPDRTLRSGAVAGYTHAPVFGGLRVEKQKGPGLLMLGAGTMLTSMAVSGFLLGYLTDQWLDSLPLFMLLFGGLGLVGGFLKVFKLLSRQV